MSILAWKSKLLWVFSVSSFRDTLFANWVMPIDYIFTALAKEMK